MKIVKYIGETKYKKRRGKNHLYNISTFRKRQFYGKLNRRFKNDDFVYVCYDFDLPYSIIKDFETCIINFLKLFNKNGTFFNTAICRTIQPIINWKKLDLFFEQVSLAIFEKFITTPPILVGFTNKKSKSYQFEKK